MLISENLINQIQTQIAHERYNATLYLFMYGFLKNKGLDKLAEHFYKQYNEELEHSIEFFTLLTDLNAPAKLKAIEEVDLAFENIVEMAKYYLMAEKLTTDAISAIKKTAMEEDNPVVEELMRKMIAKQQIEYSEATTFLDNAELCFEGGAESSWWKAKVWNDSL